jgi:hypothetical protein
LAQIGPLGQKGGGGGKWQRQEKAR